MELKKVNKLLNVIVALCKERKEIKIIFTILALLVAAKCMHEFGVSVGEALYYIIY